MQKSLSFAIDKWDSSFFKKNIARIDVKKKGMALELSKRLPQLLDKAVREKIDFLVLKLTDSASYYEKEFIRQGFKKCGESVDFVFRHKGRYAPSDRRDIKPFKPGDRKSICTIAKDAFRLSYLYRAGFAKRDAVDSYHYIWAENLSKDKDLKIFVSEEGDRINGFVAMRIDLIKKSARIILIAVRKGSRGKGIASALLRKCISWAESKIDSIFIKTQRGNKKAVSLYEKMGFKIYCFDTVLCKKIR